MCLLLFDYLKFVRLIRIAVFTAVAVGSARAGSIPSSGSPISWGTPLNIAGEYSWSQFTPLSDPGGLGVLSDFGGSGFLMTGNSANQPGNNLASYGLSSPLGDEAPNVPEPSTSVLLMGAALGGFGYRCRSVRRKITE